MTKLKVNSEIGKLEKVLIHSPDGGIGNVPAHKLHEWLYDDIVDVKHIQKEYQTFQTLLLLFLSPEKLFKNNSEFVINKDRENSLITNPEKENYYADKSNLDNERVIDTQYLLQYLLENKKKEARDLIISICAIEGVHPIRKKEIIDLFKYACNQKKVFVRKDNGDNKAINLYTEIVKVFLTGKLEIEPIYKTNENKTEYIEYIKLLEREKVKWIFPPIPNFIFTRDIGITIGDHLLITKPRFYIRKREVVLFKFISENFLGFDSSKIIAISEDDNYFTLEEKNQKDYIVNYEGGDIMMISDRHVLIGCSERTSAYATQKLVNRLFWANINNEDNEKGGIDIVSVIMIGEKRSQMHIDTILSHLREDIWALHSPLSEILEKANEDEDWYKKDYNDELLRKSENQIDKEKSVSISQFYLNSEGKELKETFYKTSDLEARNDAKYAFKKMDFLRKTKKDINGNKIYVKNGNKIRDKKDKKDIYTTPPKGLANLLQQISTSEFGVTNLEDVKFILSGMGIPPHDSREQWSDACNLLTLSEGISVGYDRNPKTALHFNEVLSKIHTRKNVINAEFDKYIIKKNNKFFRTTNDSKGQSMILNHILHVNDLFDYIVTNKLSEEKTKELVDDIRNSKSMLILLPSNELSRARGGSHCMTMPLERK